MQPCHVQGHVRINGSIAGARIPFFRRVSSFVRWFSRCVIVAAARRTEPKRLVTPRGSSSTSPGPISRRKLLHVPEVIAAVAKKFTATSCEFVLLSLLAVSGSPLFRLEFQPTERSGYPTTFFTLYCTSVTRVFSYFRCIRRERWIFRDTKDIRIFISRFDIQRNISRKQRTIFRF